LSRLTPERTAADGLHCFDPDGTLLGKLRLPEIVANVTFGGPQRNVLFVCATTLLYLGAPRAAAARRAPAPVAAEAHLARLFKRVVGVPPGAYRRERGRVGCRG